jgi:hypothetical protein
MAMEVYTAAQEWPISLPAEPDRDRPLVARRPDGVETHRYIYEYQAWWLDSMLPYSWSAIVAAAIRDGQTLVSLPVETGDGE